MTGLLKRSPEMFIVRSMILCSILLWSNSIFAQQVFNPKDSSIVCGYNSSPPTLTSGWYGLVQCNSLGYLAVVGVAGGTPIPVTGTFSATLGGFAPTPSYVTATAPSSSASAGAALPTGAVVVFYNNGTYPVSIKLGVGSATATATNDIVAAGGWLALTVGSNTYFSVYGIGGSSALVLSGGSGLATGVGGGSSGGGGTVTQGTPASTGPWIFTPWIGGSAMSATNGYYTNLLQGNAVISSSNPLFTQDAADGATGSSVPLKAMQQGVVSSGNLVGMVQADKSVAISISTATTTQLVALSGSTKIYVTAWDVIAAGTGNIQLEYGTGTNCGTGTTALTGNYNLTAQQGIAKGNGLGPVLVVPAGNALCALTSAAVSMYGSVSYTQF